ncbi:hypothetical protein B7P43_G00966 [Cryptotermes secundus]|uniref:Endonuclease/exonuclease/phosphatase domain-containing protein n=1 Tax=Cryptotermes secundus TaxID=105785 RepID=A0A2J7PG00_9NEOP|nr:hypothetical protein B7P43_G00966 [Cryptotermes secundus]
MQARPSREKPLPIPLRGQGQRAVPPQKEPELQKGPGTYKEAVTNIKVAIFRETYPEDKLTEYDQNSILEVLGRVLCRTPLGELPHLKSYRLEGGPPIHICAHQQSGQWLIKATDNYRLESGARLKATDTRNLPKHVNMALRIKVLRDITDYCYSRKKELIIGCDANAHHILLGSTGTNPRGESLTEFLVSSNLNILNLGNEPTFVVCNGKVIDLTLWTNKIGNLTSYWQVSGKLSLSDHRHICFQISNIKLPIGIPGETIGTYKDNLKVNLEIISQSICTIRDIDRSVDQLSHCHNCSAKTPRLPRNAPWWNNKLSGLRANTRKLFNTAKRTGLWDTYKETLTCYNKEIRKAK